MNKKQQGHQNQKEFMQITKAIKESYSEIRKSLKKNKSNSSSSKKPAYSGHRYYL